MNRALDTDRKKETGDGEMDTKAEGGSVSVSHLVKSSNISGVGGLHSCGSCCSSRWTSVRTTFSLSISHAHTPVLPAADAVFFFRPCVTDQINTLHKKKAHAIAGGLAGVKVHVCRERQED